MSQKDVGHAIKPKRRKSTEKKRGMNPILKIELLKKSKKRTTTSFLKRNSSPNPKGKQESNFVRQKEDKSAKIAFRIEKDKQKDAEIKKWKLLYEKERAKRINFEKQNTELSKRISIYIQRSQKKKIFKEEKNVAAAKIQRLWRKRKNFMKFRKIVYDFQKSKPGKKIRERSRIIKEIYTTEHTYVDGLDKLYKNYFEPIQRRVLGNKNSIVDYSDIKIIFNNFEQLWATHRVFLLQLKTRMTKWPFTNVGDLFSNQASMFIIYISYVNNFDAAVNRLREIVQADKGLASFLTETKKQSNGFSINSFLILPVQRLPRYRLLLRELIKQTPDTHVDYDNLVDAKKKIEKVTTIVNKKKKDSDNLYQVNRVNSILEDINFSVARRRYLKDDMALYYEAGKTHQKQGKQYVIFLFDIYIIFCKIHKLGNPQKHGKNNDLAGKLAKGWNRMSISRMGAHVDVKTGHELRYKKHYNLKGGAILVDPDSKKKRMLSLSLLDENNNMELVHFELVRPEKNMEPDETKYCAWKLKLGEIFEQYGSN